MRRKKWLLDVSAWKMQYTDPIPAAEMKEVASNVVGRREKKGRDSLCVSFKLDSKVGTRESFLFAGFIFIEVRVLSVFR